MLQKVRDQDLGWAGGGGGDEPDAFQGGEDQSSGGPAGALLGFLVWRDTKAALLMFIRTKDVTATVQSATAAIEAHPNYKRRGAHDNDGRIDVVMHANGDPDREIKLAFLPFSPPRDATSRFAKAKR
ncbi:hypothetical protein [Nonomuraea sp. B19D2]|uniref:hypothetical protein n=1 Tax=Nonomuraea sp. B19D2 TaxID=3159561 RepID=UPI0032DBF260